MLGEAFDDLTDLVDINTSGVAVGSHAAIRENSQATRWVGDHYEDLPAPSRLEQLGDLDQRTRRHRRPRRLPVDPLAGSVLTISNGRLAGGFTPHTGVIWNSGGTVERVIPDTLLYAMNTSGHLLARGDGPWYVEENGNRTALPDDFLPSGTTSLTNDGAVVGYSYDSTTFQQTATLWRRV